MRENSGIDITHKGLTDELSNNLSNMLKDIPTENRYPTINN